MLNCMYIKYKKIKEDKENEKNKSILTLKYNDKIKDQSKTITTVKRKREKVREQHTKYHLALNIDSSGSQTSQDSTGDRGVRSNGAIHS